MARRIVQIAACGVDNVSSTQCVYMVLALCDDGTLWEQRNTSSAWQCLSPIPDAPILAEAPSASANKLQAEIAALIPAVEACSGYARNGEAVRSVVAKMRQLSAVQ